MNQLQSETEAEVSNFVRKKLIVLILGVVVFWVLTTLDRCSIREREHDRKLWESWAATESSQIKMIRLSPINFSGYLTISCKIETDDKKLIREIKENMNRNYLSKEDGTGSHWLSEKRIILTAYTVSDNFSFILNFHSGFPSVLYQRLMPGSSGFDPVGERWPSAELCRILTEYINSFPDVAWVESKD